MKYVFSAAMDVNVKYSTSGVMPPLEGFPKSKSIKKITVRASFVPGVAPRAHCHIGIITVKSILSLPGAVIEAIRWELECRLNNEYLGRNAKVTFQNATR
ncbi:MAG: hypothetical protein WC976_06050 [Caldisericia bacterium]